MALRASWSNVFLRKSGKYELVAIKICTIKIWLKITEHAPTFELVGWQLNAAALGGVARVDVLEVNDVEGQRAIVEQRQRLHLVQTGDSLIVRLVQRLQHQTNVGEEHSRSRRVVVAEKRNKLMSRE